MIGFVVDSLSVLGFAWLLIVVHEYSHYVGGRMLGVPADSMRVVVANNPPHVALREGEAWLTPLDESYADVFQRHRSGVAPAWWYIAAGSVGESVVALVVIAGLMWAGADEVAGPLAWATALVFTVYLVGDAAMSLTRKVVSGDWSAMYVVQSVATVALALALGAVKIATLAWLDS